MTRALRMGLGTVLGALLVYPVWVLGAEVDAGQALRSQIATDIVVGNVPVIGEGEVERVEPPDEQFIVGFEAQNVPELTEFSAFEVEEEGAVPAHAEGLNLHYTEDVAVPTFGDQDSVW